ncbi:entericidin A/B family lipoprotein [Neisseriaceae bacterium CLB008]|nr:entericidin A/B family lipoprotein [Neisseriaceae bacterium]
MKKTILLLCTAAFILTGCNTISGVGKDIKGGGQAIENAGGK